MKNKLFILLLFLLTLNAINNALSYNRYTDYQSSTTTFIAADSLFVNYIQPKIPNSIIELV